MEPLKRRVLGVDDRAVRADSPEDYYAAATSRAKTRASPTGRVPRWVLDEAAGRDIPPVPFRGPTSIPAGHSSNFGIKARNITIFLAVAAVSVSGYLLGAPAPSAQGLLAGRETVAAAPHRQGPPPGREEAPAPRGLHRQPRLPPREPVSVSCATRAGPQLPLPGRRAAPSTM